LEIKAFTERRFDFNGLTSSFRVKGQVERDPIIELRDSFISGFLTPETLTDFQLCLVERPIYVDYFVHLTLIFEAEGQLIIWVFLLLPWQVQLAQEWHFAINSILFGDIQSQPVDV